MAKKKTKLSEQSSKTEIEKLELLQKSKEKIGRQLTLNELGEIKEVDELKELIKKDFENPEEKYNLYYLGIRKLLMDYLPKGKDYKQLRDIIYDEKNVFLNLGKKKSDNKGIRKSDGRMTFQPVMNEILDIIVDWISKSQNPFNLYKKFYDLNDKHGYGHENYDKTVNDIANAMRKLDE